MSVQAGRNGEKYAVPHDFEANSERMEDLFKAFTAPDVGGTPGGGVSRPALSTEDASVRELFTRTVQGMGLSIRHDDVGSMFARLEGTSQDQAPVLVGSHLDTVVPGGKYDGIIGVVAALEAVSMLQDHGLKPCRPIDVCNWTGEEGSRFSPAMVGSGVAAGVYTPDFVHGLRDADGLLFLDELQKCGYAGQASNRPSKIHASLELHIEQGTVLEEEKACLGIVSSIAPVRLLKVVLQGAGGHAGGPGPHGRTDPVKAGARMISLANELSLHDPTYKVTVGIIKTAPGSTNVVPHQLMFTLDLRTANDEDMTQVEAEILHEFQRIADEESISLLVEPTWNVARTAFDRDVRELLEETSQRRRVSHVALDGSIGHDSMYLAKITRAAMIFTLTVNGRSHCEDEESPWADILAATGVLAETLLHLANEP